MNSLSPMQRKLVSAVIMLSAGMWVSLSLGDNIGQLKDSAASLNLGYIAVSLIPAMISIFIAACIYYLLLSRITPNLPPIKFVMKSFVSSQVVRYLPGKVWGVFYQAQATAGLISARDTIKANIEHFLLVNINSIAVAIAVFTYYMEGIVTALSFFFIAEVFIFLNLRTSFLRRVVSVTSRLSGLDREPFYSRRSNNKDMLILSLLQAEWLFYFIACVLILPAYFSIESAVVVATCYAIAWLIGALSIVLPSGLFVREASFIWLGSLLGFPLADLLAFSVVARILFTLADLASAALSNILLNGGVEKG